MTDNQLMCLESAFEPKDELSDLSPQELMLELFKAKKVYNGLCNRATFLMTRMADGSYNPTADELEDNAATIDNIKAQLSPYMASLLTEIGERIGLEPAEVSSIDQAAYDIVDF